MPRFILPALAALSLTGCAAEAEESPAPALELTGRVVDAADILSSDFEAEMTERLAALEDDTRVQMVVATTPNLNGREIDAYSLELANNWGIGDSERNDGLLILVAPNERKVRIEIGRGLEKTVTNEEASVIIEDAILPYFRESDYRLGIEKGVEGLVREVSPLTMEKAA